MRKKPFWITFFFVFFYRFVVLNVFSLFHRSLIEQLKKLQAMMKLSTMKASTTSTCVMVLLLSFEFLKNVK